MLLDNDDFTILQHNCHSNEWNFFQPNIKNNYAIHTFDDGNEPYSTYKNEWYVVGKWKGKVCLLNKYDKIFLHSISKWKTTKIDHSYTIDAMIRCKDIFSTLQDECKNTEFQQIEADIKRYIVKHCNHQIIEDYIDIDPDRGKYIRYCEHCHTSFK